MRLVLITFDDGREILGTWDDVPYNDEGVYSIEPLYNYMDMFWDHADKDLIRSEHRRLLDALPPVLT